MAVKENFIQDFENQDYSFDDLVSKLNLPRQSNRTPLVETMLTKLDALSNQDNGAVNQNVGLQSRGWVFEHFPAKFELALDVLDFDGSMKMWLTYSTRLFKPSTIEKIKEHYLEIFEQVVKNLDIKLEEIQISSGLEAASPIILQDESGDFGF